MNNSEKFREALKQLSDAYTAQLPQKLINLELIWDKFPQDQWDEACFQTLYRMVHSLSGSARTFGFPALGDAARTLENHLKMLGEAKRALSSTQRDQVYEQLAALNQLAIRQEHTDADSSAAVSAESAVVHASHQIFIVEDDSDLAVELKIQLSYFGYDVSVFNALNDFKAAMQQSRDVVVLMDINFPEDPLGGIHAMNEVQRGRATPIPVIFLSAHGEFDIRLEAVRAGGIAYMNKPVNMGVLVGKLDELTSVQAAEADRVLIVDDEVTLADYYAAALGQAGLSVRVANNPLHVLNYLVEFSPDLILIDMYMPECNGMELAKVIRQLDDFIGIPIVFLSSETDVDKQLAAIGIGGDDFLCKPIAAQHLVSSVTSRIRRSQLLRSFMVRDSLTGLLNHTAIKDQLAREIARAKRLNKPLSFAMVDIDFFKNVNDSYGHPVGDRVIKSLSRLLKQRLREIDAVGRYGGEEFAVILVDTDGQTAMKVMDTIRHDFSLLRHLAGETEFSVSFSCGIADISDYVDVSRMADAADRALYQAKHAGRNRIVLADGESTR
ncbi:MAG: diguanylate cyclase [Gallionella sp.]|nr:diguanylate cyclase [Gallionella sp.]